MLKKHAESPNNIFNDVFLNVTFFVCSIMVIGIHSYNITDTTINTPDVINNGDLAVQIAAAPTRTAENIVVEFIANKYTEEVSASESMN